MVKVRFAPSPTGVLHIGSVRTALFNWLFARHNNGKFVLRIEDTDKLRSTDDNINLIFKVLNWLDINWDEKPVIQSTRINRHLEVAYDLVKSGRAYYCYCSQEELALKKEKCLAQGKTYKYDGKCRNLNRSPSNTEKPVIRLKANNIGTTSLNDLVQGEVTVNNEQIDDLILVRGDGTPTFMLSVVVDDHDMGITHIIRGADHLTNTFRHIQIYQACNWEIPQFGHIPLIYAPDGTKLSKRHGAASTIDYMKLGYLPEAIFNYLLRLGWSHENDEIISREEAISLFDIGDVGKSPSKFDLAKLKNINMHYIKKRDNLDLLNYCLPFYNRQLLEEDKSKILSGMNSLKERAKTIIELIDNSMIYIQAPERYEDKCQKYASAVHLQLLQNIIQQMENGTLSCSENELCQQIKEFAQEKNIKLIEIAQAMRGALCGKLASPSVFEIISILGFKQTIERFKKFINYFSKNN